MYGDFSQRQLLAEANFAGVLYQQGRVFLDTDGNAQTGIANRWQDTAARDAFGARVAAIPADAPDSFHVDSATIVAAPHLVDLIVQPGRCWADGLLVELEGNAPVLRGATYLTLPVANPVPNVNGLRDAVVLEVWRESLSAFQQTNLLEPALGGIDTTERVFTSSAFRLLRLNDGETCTNIAGRLDDNFAGKGRLTVTLQPTVAVGGDCPVVDSGGYVGFEHNLYRIEIADLPGQPVHFKWSQFNGGLVGRAEFDGPALRARIHANLQAIVTSGLPGFYLETRELDPYLGHWRATYGANVTLNNLNELVLPAVPVFGIPPAAGTDVFFRLWNELRPITDFPLGAANALVDGIRLEFDPDAPGRYLAEDYWTFTVRADGVENALVPGLMVPTLLDAEPPEGIHHHRVPLGILEWDGTNDVTSAEGNIEDCREIFPPLTRIKGCCTFRVGDGIHSFGDFDSIVTALQHLPPEGGEICLLPGVFTENVLIEDRVNVRIHGCGYRSRVVAPTPAGGAAGAPVFIIRDSRGITLDTFAVEATTDAAGIVVNGNNTEARPGGGVMSILRDVKLLALRITAGGRSGIQVLGGQFIKIRDCDVRMRNVTGSFPAVYVRGDDVEIEHNQLRVRSPNQVDDGPTLALPVATGLGGLQIGGTSERVRIIDNWIQGGRANGITLGSVVVEVIGGGEVEQPGWIVDADDPCDPCRPGSSHLPDPGGGGGERTISAGALYDIRIERNRIYDMGMNGIGVVAFFDLSAQDEFISVFRLEILGNEIRRCLIRGVDAIDDAMISTMGYGAIQLADVTDCVIVANTLVDNGPSQLEPVCGVYVLHAEGIDISGNRILNTGAKTLQPDYAAKDGPRSGIHLAFAVAPTDPAYVDLLNMLAPMANGTPAAKIHDNVVSQPLGQALWIVALGPVSVEGNQLTSQGVVLRFRPLSSTFLAATVFILDLGLSNENYLQFFGFAYTTMGTLPDLAAFDGDSYVVPQEGLDDLRLAHILAGGNVLFADNQVTLELQSAGFDLALTSITILSLDDIAFESNQCDCNLIFDFVVAQAALLGLSVRVVGNRFKEPRYNAGFSAITFGYPMNATTDNQATHCIWADSSNPFYLAGYDDNRMLYGPFGSSNSGNERCAKFVRKPG